MTKSFDSFWIVAKKEISQILTRAHRISKTGQYGDKYGADQIQNGPNQVHFDRSIQFRTLPAQVRQTTDGQTNGQPGSESDVGKQKSDVFDQQVEQGQNAHANNGRGRSHFAHLNHRKHLRHLVVLSTGEEQTAETERKYWFVNSIDLLLTF